MQAKQLEMDVARALLIQCANAIIHIKELEPHEDHLEQEAVRKAQQEANILLGGTLSAQNKYEEVDAFLKQFETPQHRYKFLVLSGPSRVGKSLRPQSVRPWFGCLGDQLR